MIYAETKRLVLRALEKSDLPRIVELLSDREVARWLTSVPCPYDIGHAEEYRQRMQIAAEKGRPEYFLLQRKSDGPQIGAIGLHPPREPFPTPGELVIGYWLGRDYWGQGFMSEAVKPVINIGFRRAEVALINAGTDPANLASQQVLRNSGFDYLGISFLRDSGARRRQSSEVTRWQLLREDHAKGETF